MLLFNNSTFTKYILAEMYSDKKHINITDVPSQKGAMLLFFSDFCSYQIVGPFLTEFSSKMKK